MLKILSQKWIGEKKGWEGDKGENLREKEGREGVS